MQSDSHECCIIRLEFTKLLNILLEVSPVGIKAAQYHVAQEFTAVQWTDDIALTILNQIWYRNLQEFRYNMHCPSSIYYMEAKFWPLEERIKNDWHQSRLNTSEEEPVHIFWPRKEWRNFVRAESRTIWLETKKMQIKLAPTCNKNEEQRDGKK